MIGLVLLGLLMTAGCSEAGKRKWRARPAEENYRLALESDAADERRSAIAQIGESGYYKSEAAFAVLDTAARTDPQPQIRCIAIRTLGRYDDDRPVDTLLTILQPTPLQSNQDARSALPANGDVRWEAASALHALHRKDLVDPAQQAATRALFIRLLQSDPDRNVKIIAARALGLYQHPDVFPPLINALRNNDFMIADRAEQSLIELTGVTHHYDADAWQAWLETTEHPFEFAGRVPQTTQPAGPSWWEQQQRAWQRALKLKYD